MKQEFRIHSGKLPDSSDRLLSIRIGEKHIGFSVSTYNAQELYGLAWYSGIELGESQLAEILESNPVLSESFSAILLCYDTSRTILAPITIQEGQFEELLEAGYGKSAGQRIISESIPGWQIQNIYTIDESMEKWVRQRFPQARIMHSHSIGIRQIEATAFEGCLDIVFHADEMSVLVSRANKLLLARNFCYANPADVIYVLLDICAQFGFSQEELRICLSGFVDKESALYREIYQYFIHVRFREPSWILMSDEAGDYPSHFFTSLNDLAKCAL